jgi:hypothetical protein
MRLQSPAFDHGQPIPRTYTEDGENISPALSFAQVPPKTRELALIMEDPDAPRPDPWVHWLLYAIPAHLRDLPPALPRDPVLRNHHDMRQGINSWGLKSVGYRGPAPPKGHGRHRYYFKLFALDQPLDLAERVEKGALIKAMENHILAHAELMGTYER